MDATHSLPAHIYLTAYDTKRGKLTRTSRLGHLVRTAALEELLIRGLISDRDGKVVAADRATAHDPVLDGVLAMIRESAKLRDWKHWVAKKSGTTRDALRDQLAAARVIRAERKKWLGVIPHTLVTVRDTRLPKQLQTTAARALTGATPTTRLDQREVALAALAAVGELDTVCKGSVRRENRARIKELLALSGPAVPALKKVLVDEAASSAAT